ncbi:hypothetical protein [Pedobacter montanisoli]|uniref:MFS transporter n=1 Tax=Pedobacter montanisoli TaxID=2923277 RepID=A0ABS9ZSI7_9SPHI|nr:hypothetical protein [Pedobacter montanisoli]MCJ0741544.1 hypothetical protein [Pedobacter montanisoli]
MNLKTLNTLHLSFCLAVLFFALATYFTYSGTTTFTTQMAASSSYFLLFPLVALLSITIGNTLFSRILLKARQLETFEQKTVKYQSGFIIRCALIEGGAFLNIVAFMLSGNLIFMVFAGISLLGLLSCKPTKAKVVADLELSFPDTERL